MTYPCLEQARKVVKHGKYNVYWMLGRAAARGGGAGAAARAGAAAAAAGSARPPRSDTRRRLVHETTQPYNYTTIILIGKTTTAQCTAKHLRAVPKVWSKGVSPDSRAFSRVRTCIALSLSVVAQLYRPSCSAGRVTAWEQVRIFAGV